MMDSPCMSIHLSLLGTVKVYLGLALHSSNCSTNKKHLKETKLTLNILRSWRKWRLQINELWTRM